MVVVSHEDLDHAGGVGELRWIFPDTAFWISGRDRGQSSCVEGWSWRWGGARFKALHPSVGLPYLGNDSSCTISVKSAAGSLLLPGDISAVVERRLLAGGISPHTFLLVPHHGSATSSSEDFIAAVNPSLAIATTALGNRFDFPRPEVRRRYQSRGIRFLTTGECGAIRLRLEHGEVLGINSARRERKRIWRWPPASNCP